MGYPIIGWIGLGNMGSRMVPNLLNSGYRVVAYDIKSSRVQKACSMGAAAATTSGEVARESDIIFSILSNDAALLSVVSDEGGVASVISADKIFVDMSTVSPITSATVAGQLAQSGALYLRAPVSGSTALASAARLSVFCSGPEAAFERCRPILEKISRHQTYSGHAEEARILKLLVNMIVGITPAVLGEALAFGLLSGLSRDQIIDAIAQSAAASPVVQYKAEMLKRREWSAMASIDLAAKDLDLALEWARLRGVPMPFTSLTQQFISGFQGTHDGGQDFFFISTWPERLLSSKSRNLEGPDLAK